LAVRTIVLYPDPRLREKAQAVVDFDNDLRILAEEIQDAMARAPGVGITAPHVGILKRLVVIQLEPSRESQIYVNPQIVWSSEDTIRHTEGSVSMPGVTEEIVRPARIRVQYQTLDGTERTEEAEDFLSVCLQHEIDQLDGVFWIDRLSKLKRDRVIKRYEKIRRARG
jgi:peptide deformylase